MDLLKMDKNMFLRDEFSSDEDLCSYYDVDVKDFNEKLESLNLKYDREVNQIKNC